MAFTKNIQTEKQGDTRLKDGEPAKTFTEEYLITGGRWIDVV